MLRPLEKKKDLFIRVRGFPERDILSLRTLGLGLDRFGAFFRRRFSKVGNPRKQAPWMGRDMGYLSDKVSVK